MAHHASPPTVSGSIACYKLLDLASKLTQAGAVVDVIMTDAATRFATPLAFQSITGHPAHTSLWSNDAHVLHVGLAERADVMLIAPAMDGSMFSHPATLANVQALQARGLKMLGPV
jgi:phosphopantothenoylcysteine decarboxylase / phosphopantothenate---cysteine ligase